MNTETLINIGDTIMKKLLNELSDFELDDTDNLTSEDYKNLCKKICEDEGITYK